MLRDRATQVDIAARMSLLEAAAATRGVRLRVRSNRNTRVLVSLRQQRGGAFHLSVHETVLADADAWPDLQRFAREGGRGDYPALRACMDAVVRAQHPDAPPRYDGPDMGHLPCIGEDFDFWACYLAMHADYFAKLPRPRLQWGRWPAQRPQRKSIRFASYRRGPGEASITLSPMLAQPWVAVCFVEHVLHHELCHHAQAMWPMPGERQHSARFRAWERAYRHFHDARNWENQYIERFLRPVDG